METEKGSLEIEGSCCQIGSSMHGACNNSKINERKRTKRSITYYYLLHSFIKLKRASFTVYL